MSTRCRNAATDPRAQTEPVVAADTAGAAAEIADTRRSDHRGDRLRARRQDLRPGLAQAQNIEDAEHNTTRFLIMSRDAEARAARQPDRDHVSFHVRNVPAALYKALGGFATNGVNMTKLESYMVGGAFTATQFYADVEAHPDDRPLAAGARGARVLLARGQDSRASIPPTPAHRRIGARGKTDEGLSE